MELKTPDASGLGHVVDGREEEGYVHFNKEEMSALAENILQDLNLRSDQKSYVEGIIRKEVSACVDLYFVKIQTIHFLRLFTGAFVCPRQDCVWLERYRSFQDKRGARS